MKSIISILLFVFTMTAAATPIELNFSSEWFPNGMKITFDITQSDETTVSFGRPKSDFDWIYWGSERYLRTGYISRDIGDWLVIKEEVFEEDRSSEAWGSFKWYIIAGRFPYDPSQFTEGLDELVGIPDHFEFSADGRSCYVIPGYGAECVYSYPPNTGVTLVSWNLVSEPATWQILLAGTGFLLFGLRRKRSVNQAASIA